MQTSKGKLISMTLHQKAAMIKQIDEGRSTKEVAREFGVNQNTLRYMYKTKEKILLETYKSGSLNRKRIKQTKCPELEESVINWMKMARTTGEKITGSQIKSFALETAEKSGHEKFSASNGWLCSFLKRHSIVLSEFNKGSDSSVQLIKLQRSDIDVSVKRENEELFDYDPEVVAEEPEMLEEEVTDFCDFEEIVDENASSWKNWCRFCGQSETVTSLNASLNEIFNQLFRSQPDESLKICQKCHNFLQSAKAFVERVAIVDSMILELDEIDQKKTLSEEMALIIRKEYGLDNVEGEKSVEKDETMMACEEIKNENQQQMEEDEEEHDELVYMEKSNTADYSNETISEVHYDDDDQHQDSTVEFVEFEEVVTSPQQNSIESEYNFTCHMCQHTFDRMFHLNNHTHKEHNCLPQVACITCGKFLATWDTILSHRRKHGKEKSNFVCKFCDWRSISQTGLAIHQKLMHNGQKEKNLSSEMSYNCDLCFKEFKDATMLRLHQRVHLPDDQKFVYSCDFCNKRLGSKYSLKQHIEAFHVEKSSLISCNLCGKTFNYASNLRSHLISHTNEAVTCPVCNATFKNRVSYQSHKKLHQDDKKNVECPKCDKKFYNRTHLRQHLISHSLERNFVCNVEGCTSSYKYEKDLNNHMYNHHDPKSANSCVICSKKFRSKEQLERHIYKLHNAEVDMEGEEEET